jgi:FG-GAP repeat
MGVRRVQLLSLAVLLVSAMTLLARWEIVNVLAAPQSVQAGPTGCQAGLESDFNGDGYSDAVLGDPYATVAGQAQAGRVVVLYGDSDGRIGEGKRETLTQGAANVGGMAEADDRFGLALAAADLNCDRNTDLVVGTPYEDIGGQPDSGHVQVIWGAATGLGTGDVSDQFTQVDFGEMIRAGDQFGYAVDALEDVRQDGTRTSAAYILAVGVPGGDVGTDIDAGWVGTLTQSGSGRYVDALSQDTKGIPGATEPGDRFGTSVSLSYLLGEVHIADVAIGAPQEDVGRVLDAGAVTIVRDLYRGVDGAVVYHQDSAGVASVPETGDRFGHSLDAMRTGRTSRLAVGAPYEDIGDARSAGLVQLFSGDGSTLAVGTGLSQNTGGVADQAERGDLFGERVAWARPGLGDTVSRLAVSAPAEDGVADNTGLVQVFPLSNLAAELSYTQSSPGIPGAAEAGDRFGSSLAVVSGATERALLVGVPGVGDSTGMVNVIPFAGGTPRSWVPGLGGVPGGAGRFGYSVASSG